MQCDCSIWKCSFDNFIFRYRYNRIMAKARKKKKEDKDDAEWTQGPWVMWL